MNERERAVLATLVVTAMKLREPSRLDNVIERLGQTPWHPELVEVLKAVRYEIGRQRHATKPKR